MNALKIIVPLVGAFAVVAYIVGMFFTPVWEPPLFTGQSLHTRNPDSVVGLINSVPLVSDGFYDTYESPRGTPYQVPAGKRLVIVHLEGMPHKGGGPEAIELGYASTSVSNQATAAVDYTALYRYTFEVSSLSEAHHDAWVVIPAGAYPTLYLSGEGAISATGVLIDD